MGYGQHSVNSVGRHNPLPEKPKSTRYKEVYSDNSEIAHMWAHKAQASARNPRGNFYYNGATIYSYRDSFPVATIVTLTHGPNKGKEIVYITDNKFSVTTAKHIGDVWAAIHRYDRTIGDGEWVEAGRKVFRVHRPLDSQAAMVRYWGVIIGLAADRVVDAPKGTRGTTKARLYNEYIALIARANDWAQYIGERKRWKAPESMETLAATLAGDRKRAQIADDKARAKAAKERIKRDLQERLDDHETIQRWINGNEVRVPYDVVECYLRVERAKYDGSNPSVDYGDGELVTSKGARMPLDHARKALRLIRAVVARGEDWHRNGQTIRLGHYQIDSIAANGDVKAGCHFVTYAEIERIAPQIENTGGNQ